MITHKIILHSISLLSFFSNILALNVEGTAITTRYFDCCLPSCSYPSKADYSSLLKSAKSDGTSGNANGPSGCITTSKDASFTDSKQVPIAIDDSHSIGFVATGSLNGKTEKDLCCSCILLTFTSGPVIGKTMTVQVTNTGGDLNSDHFDIAIPGAGAGIFQNGCVNQYGGNFNYGAQYGGINNRNDCNNLPFPQQAGCKWRFDWFLNADNPSVIYKSIECPSSITSISGCVRSDSNTQNITNKPSSSPVTSTPQPSKSQSNTSQPSKSQPTTLQPSKSQPTNNPNSIQCKNTEWMQCGGKNYFGQTCCKKNYKCKYLNEYWSSCQFIDSYNGCTNKKWQQCNGKNYSGLSCCPSNTTCTKLNDYYSQCL